MLKYLYKKYFDKGKYQIISQNISDAEMPTYYAFGIVIKIFLLKNSSMFTFILKNPIILLYCQNY